MGKPILILVHGMGSHKKGDITKTFSAGLNATLSQFHDHKQSKIEKLVDIREINYDAFFDTVRKGMADRAKPIAERLKGIASAFDLRPPQELVLKLTSLESQFGDDEFLYTHVLDVVFYVTLLGEKVRVDVAKDLADVIKNSSDPVHIVAHSLGTSVVADTLGLLYRNGFDAADQIPDLDPITHRLASLTQIANVSRLTHSVSGRVDPMKSVVKPTPEGCVSFFCNVRHELDPFTWLKRFDPPRDGSWIPNDEYDMTYEAIVTSAITKPNTHDLGEYVKNPKVTRSLLASLLGFFPSNAEIARVQQDYMNTTIPGAFDELKEALEDIDVSEGSTLKRLAAAGKTFWTVVNAFEQELDAFVSTDAEEDDAE